MSAPPEITIRARLNDDGVMTTVDQGEPLDSRVLALLLSAIGTRAAVELRLLRVLDALEEEAAGPHGPN